MDKAYHEQIFEMFKRLHNNEKYKGTGIGLAICKKIITQLEGEIQVESSLNVGSTFHLIFPKSILWTAEISNEKELELQLEKTN